MATMMDAMDAVYGSKAECYMVINGRRLNFMTLIDFEAEWSVNITEVPILGKVGMGHKPAGGKGTWKATAHYNQSHFRAMAEDYQKTGVMKYFSIEVTNEDPTSRVGRQTVIYNGCLCEKFILSKFIAGEDILDEEMSGTYETFDIKEKFKELPGM